MLTDFMLFGGGLIVGAMNAIAGGGTIIGFPLLLTAGLSALGANATSNIVVLPGQIASVFGYRKYLRKVPRQYLILLIPSVVGALIGAYILRHTPRTQFAEIVPLLVLIAVVLFAFQPLIHLHLHHHLHSRNKRLQTLLIIAIALFPVAVYGGYFGAGFGFVMLAFLGFTSLHDVHQMNALKNLASITIALASLLVLAKGPFINWHYGIVMAIGSTIGGYAGARMAQRVSSHALRIVVIVIGILAVIYVGVRSY